MSVSCHNGLNWRLSHSRNGLALNKTAEGWEGFQTRIDLEVLVLLGMIGEI